MKIVKTSDKHKTITFAVLVPNEEDRNWDIISEDEIIKTAHEFWKCMCEKYLNIDHDGRLWIDKDQYDFVENFVLPQDMGDLPKWTWLLWIKFKDDELYQAVKNWEFVWISMEGYMIVE